jgi:hypothetical protein
MTRTLLAFGAAAVALTATSVPAEARHHGHAYAYGHATCAKWRHGHCVRWRHGRHMASYRVGYVFGPDYAYTDLGALPRPLVTRYNLRDNFRYVNRNGVVYVVSPRTYRVVRVITVR